ncbi:hypothetical protein LINGRAHAP2_LOCUS11169 [Linum grandiflorum]
MPNKLMARERLLIVFHKLSDRLRTSIRSRKLNLAFLSRRFLKHKYNVDADYYLDCRRHGQEFSASSTPLIYPRRYRGNYLDSLLLLFRAAACFGGGDRASIRLSIGTSFQNPDGVCWPEEQQSYDYGGALVEWKGGEESWEGDEDSVDLKAERFIERFYMEMRLQQRRRSL